ncbi:MAG: two pore domain potassium channel family protein [Algoriphagus sp.]|uniref:potassium channel family protein n=1 Tax=Algoriphagus sp. TaxID=1872435 RepID=UPI0017AA92B2|nr:potassium channel family protein [Algoriphagus sp.]NVJ87642.1 two pore domain potassium channel family protein [Algoriphagus sp.]
MRYLILVLGLIFPLLTFSQTQNKNELAEYSYSEFFQMIENEEDSVFRLDNALIFYNKLTDESFLAKENTSSTRSDTIHIRKALELENVVFDPFNRFSLLNRYLNQIEFHEKVVFTNVFGSFQNIRFLKISIGFNEYIPQLLEEINSNSKIETFSKFERLYFNKVIFDSDPHILCLKGGKQNVMLEINDCKFGGQNSDARSFFLLQSFGRVRFTNNQFKGSDSYSMSFFDNSDIVIENNDFGERFIDLDFPIENEKVDFVNNKYDFIAGLSLNENTSNFTIDWTQFQSGLINSDAYYDFLLKMAGGDNLKGQEFEKDAAILLHYKDAARFADNAAFREEIKLLGTINDIYKKQHDIESANASYIALKDLQTQRLQYVYQENPSFDTFFEWKVNQFLKIFSDYGTKPSKAITMSVYVILIFALIYLFFPNYWDSHGKDRMLYRYHFFLKYLNQNAGMHDVYLENKRDELAHYEGFRKFFEENGKTVPKIFLATALPLYRWSTASTKTSSWLLQKIDIFKGKWSDLPAQKKAIKTVLLLLVFFIAILYDLFIKMLNALMLSINTFTTLGFGEIPIKGLPRYLAIIQGFIGWFMLTIFSVSLISQLLN